MSFIFAVMMWPILLFYYLLLQTVSSSLESQKSYANYRVLKVRPTNKESHDVLVSLQQAEDVAGSRDVDFWKLPRHLDQDVTIAVSSSAYDRVVSMLEGAGMQPEIIEDDLQGLVNDELQENQMERLKGFMMRTGSGFSLNIYHRYHEITAYLDAVGSSCERCEVINIGESYQRRDMKVMKISSRSDGPDGSRSSRPAVWIDAGIHAREWIAPATALNMIDKLVHIEKEDVETQRLMNSFDWYILPCVNPDGYEFTWLADRFWRKTRSPNGALAFCKGADANRNWDFHWMDGGSSDNPCSDTYAGSAPFSEPENRNVAKFIATHKDTIKVYLSFHSFGQYWLIPWGFTNDLPDDYDDLEAVSNAAGDAIKDYSGKSYTIGSVTNVLYAASGGSADWAKGFAGIKYAFTAELRDSGRYGFVLPPRKIKKQGKEMWAALKGAVGEVSRQMEEEEGKKLVLQQDNPVAWHPRQADADVGQKMQEESKRCVQI